MPFLEVCFCQWEWFISFLKLLKLTNKEEKILISVPVDKTKNKKESATTHVKPIKNCLHKKSQLKFVRKVAMIMDTNMNITKRSTMIKNEI
jgi:hypothetical protein